MSDAAPASEILAGRLAVGPVVLDGGLATRLEARGHDLSDDLWSARLLLDDPGAVVAAHADFFAAGAQVAITASYQVSFEGLAERGVDAAGTERVLRRSVELAREAAAGAEARWVAASVGPYGAALAGGEEYVGDYGLTVQQLRDWHRTRLAALIEAAPDLLAIETVPCLAEVEALLHEVAGSGMPCWVSLTADGARTRLGEPVREAFAMVRDVPEVVAVGVNCCTAETADAVVGMAAAESGKPVVVYPNSGEGWDGPGRRWTGRPTFGTERVLGWVEDGARLVGGCCRVAPVEIARIADLLSRPT